MGKSGSIITFTFPQSKLAHPTQTWPAPFERNPCYNANNATRDTPGSAFLLQTQSSFIYFCKTQTGWAGPCKNQCKSRPSRGLLCAWRGLLGAFPVKTNVSRGLLGAFPVKTHVSRGLLGAFPRKHVIPSRRASFKMWRWRYPLIQSLLKAKLQPSLISPWSNSSLLYENYIYSDFQTNTLHPKPIATYYVPSPSVTNQNKNAKKTLLSGMGNNYLLWLMRLLALLMTTPVPFTTNLSSFEQQTTQTNTTLHTSQVSNHLLISKLADLHHHSEVSTLPISAQVTMDLWIIEHWKDYKCFGYAV